MSWGKIHDESRITHIFIDIIKLFFMGSAALQLLSTVLLGNEDKEMNTSMKTLQMLFTEITFEGSQYRYVESSAKAPQTSFFCRIGGARAELYHGDLYHGE